MRTYIARREKSVLVVPSRTHIIDVRAICASIVSLTELVIEVHATTGEPYNACASRHGTFARTIGLI